MADAATRRARWVGGAAFGALGIFAGAGVFTFHSAQGTSYLSNDPAACVNCHIMRDQYDGWQKSPHHAHATCNDCHLPQDLVGKYVAKAVHGWRHSKAFTLQDFHEPIQIRVEDAAIVRDNCVRCHSALVEPMAHVGEAEPTDCLKCHGAVGHGPHR